jgi:hypothetical protein
MRNRARLGWFLAGAIVVATLGGPLAGAVGSMFWRTEATDVLNDDTLAAERVLDRVETSPQRVTNNAVPSPFTGWGIVSESSLPDHSARCPNTLGDLDLRPDGYPGSISVTIWAAIDQWAIDRDRDIRRLILIQALTHMPKPLLGALDGCVSASPLASMCRSYARDVMLRAKQREANAIADADRTIIRHQDDETCALNFMTNKAGGISEVEKHNHPL